MALTRRLSAAAASVAALSMLATPVAAVELPRSAPAIYKGDIANGWGRHRHRDRVDAGDVLAGVLILGTIAAVASAASKNNRSERYPAPREPYPRDRQGYRDNSYNYDGDGRGLDRAVDMCVDQVERGQDRVGTVDGANRTADGWTVSGALESGAGFTCRIDNDGRIRDVDIGGYSAAAAGPVEDRQYSDDVYAKARMSQGSVAPTVGEPGVAPSDGVDNRPVWHGDDGNYGG